MIGFDEALSIAKDARDGIDNFTEYEDAYIFGSSRDDDSFGYMGPVVVLKENGSCINMTAFLIGDYSDEEIRSGKL